MKAAVNVLIPGKGGCSFLKLICMNISEQVCTLEQAKRLKELGVNQDTWFCYYKYLGSDNYKLDSEFAPKNGKRIAAFTVAELGVMLPSEIYTTRTGSEDSEYANWEWIDEGNQRGMGMFNTEAEARADALISSIENKLITPEDINQRIS